MAGSRSISRPSTSSWAVTACNPTWRGRRRLAELQPRIADGLLCSSASASRSGPSRCSPGSIMAAWSWNGLIAGIGDAEASAEWLPTGIASIAEMADWLKLSRTHLARKLREAEELGSIGWLGKRGHSTMWVSEAFRREYAEAQAVKLAIIDQAFSECFRGVPRMPRSVARREAPGNREAPRNSQRSGASAN